MAKSALDILNGIADELSSGESDDLFDENFLPLMVVVRARRYLQDPDGYRRRGDSSVDALLGG